MCDNSADERSDGGTDMECDGSVDNSADVTNMTGVVVVKDVQQMSGGEKLVM